MDKELADLLSLIVFYTFLTIIVWMTFREIRKYEERNK